MRALLVVSLLSIPTLVISSLASAKDAKPTVALSAGASVIENIRNFSKGGSVVTLHLKSGKEVSGKVAEVGSAAVVLTQLTGRDLNDSMIPVDSIAAVEVKMR